MSDMTDSMRSTSTKRLLNTTTISGSGGAIAELRPGEVTKTLLAQQILYAVRKQFKGLAQIAREVKADSSYVAEHAEQIVRAEVLSQHAEAFRANCILLDREDEGYLRRQLRGRGTAVAGIVKEFLPDIEEVLGCLSSLGAAVRVEQLRWAEVTAWRLKARSRTMLNSQPPVGVVEVQQSRDGQTQCVRFLVDVLLHTVLVFGAKDPVARHP